MLSDFDEDEGRELLSAEKARFSTCNRSFEIKLSMEVREILNEADNMSFEGWIHSAIWENNGLTDL